MNRALLVSAELHRKKNDRHSNYERKGGELNNIRPTESDIKSLNLNDNIEER